MGDPTCPSGFLVANIGLLCHGIPQLVPQTDGSWVKLLVWQVWPGSSTLHSHYKVVVKRCFFMQVHPFTQWPVIVVALYNGPLIIIILKWR